jgi:conjugal transfer pilus assembly protein TraA
LIATDNTTFLEDQYFMNTFSLKNFRAPSISKQAIAFGLLALAVGVNAGTTGVEFQALFTLIDGWVSGYLGKALALGAFLIGAMVGMAKSTVMPALVGLGFAIVFSVGPGVITGMMTAVI